MYCTWMCYIIHDITANAIKHTDAVFFFTNSKHILPTLENWIISMKSIYYVAAKREEKTTEKLHDSQNSELFFSLLKILHDKWKK